MLKPVQIGAKKLEVPIIQGGMGVGVSLSGLAGAVMKEGGMGVISAAHPGYAYPGFEADSVSVNCQALHEEAKKARKAAQGNGILAVNIMCASKDYETYVQASLDAGYEVLICGAGLPLKLPALVKESAAAIAPIVSSAKAAQLICKVWLKRYDRLPDFVILEGPKAGGHLGFGKEELQNGSCLDLDALIPQVKSVLDTYGTMKNIHIPLFAAGGIFDGQDIQKALALGADGVQMATRFIATHECDAAPAFKQALIEAKEEDVFLVKSPAGFPGRALKSPMMNEVMSEIRQPIQKCLRCLSPCNPGQTPYCISQALIAAVKGDWAHGLFFVGANAPKVKEMLSVSQLMNQLKREAEGMMI